MNLGKIMQERELNINHTMIMRWVHQYEPEPCGYYLLYKKMT